MHPRYAFLLIAVTALTLIWIPVLAGAQGSGTDGWDFIGAVAEGPEGGRIEIYLMRGLVKGPPDSREFLEKAVWQKDGKTVITKNLVDCHTKVRRTTLINEYQRQRLEGSDRYSLVKSEEPRGLEMKVEPGTVAEQIYNDVCFTPGSNSFAVPAETGATSEEPDREQRVQESSPQGPDLKADVTPPPEKVSEASSPACTYSLSPGSQSYSSSAGSGSISLSTQNKCQWKALSNVAWVSIESPDQGSGSGTIRFLLQANTDAGSRTAQIAVEGELFSITQGGSPEVVEYPLTVKKIGSGQGTVTANPAGTLFRNGTSVTLSALPGARSTFSGWSGACSGTGQTCSIKVISATSVFASFALKAFTISVKPSSNGAIYPPGPVRASYGEERTFRVFPLPGYRVSDVLVDGASVGTVGSYRFRGIVADHEIEATFVKEE